MTLSERINPKGEVRDWVPAPLAKVPEWRRRQLEATAQYGRVAVSITRVGREAAL
jgi:hypothetical protein